MGLESGTVINDLQANWPLASDNAAQGDDHLRLIKSILKNVFGNNPAPMRFEGNDLVLGPTDDISARSIQTTADSTMPGRILGNASTVLACGTIDGATGALVGPNYGVAATMRRAEGEYQIQLQQTGWENVFDLVGAFNVTYIFAAGTWVMADPIAPQTIANGWFRVITTNIFGGGAGSPNDCGFLQFLIFWPEL